MRKGKKSWMAVVAATVLLVTLVGAVWARSNDSPEAADITRKVTVPAASFFPTQNILGCLNTGRYVTCASGGSCIFSAPVVFPCLPSVTVERIKLHVRDHDATYQAQATLYKANPSTAADRYCIDVSSPTGTSGGLQTYTSVDISKVVWPSQGAHILLSIGSSDVRVFGVTVEYHRNI